MQQASPLTYVRVNNGQQGIKTLKPRMIDSTYVNAADPNSMRDQGMVRNAEYTWALGSHQARGSDFDRF